MAKTNYQVTFDGKVVGIRKSDRIDLASFTISDADMALLLKTGL